MFTRVARALSRIERFSASRSPACLRARRRALRGRADRAGSAARPARAARALARRSPRLRGDRAALERRVGVAGHARERLRELAFRARAGRRSAARCCLPPGTARSLKRVQLGRVAQPGIGRQRRLRPDPRGALDLQLAQPGARARRQRRAASAQRECQRRRASATRTAASARRGLARTGVDLPTAARAREPAADRTRAAPARRRCRAARTPARRARRTPRTSRTSHGRPSRQTPPAPPRRPRAPSGIASARIARAARQAAPRPARRAPAARRPGPSATSVRSSTLWG